MPTDKNWCKIRKKSWKSSWKIFKIFTADFASDTRTADHRGRGKCDWLLLFAYALPISLALSLSCLQCAWYYWHAPCLPEAACSFDDELGLFAFAYHRRMSRGIADGVPVPVVLVSVPVPVPVPLLIPLLAVLPLLPVLAGWRQQ